MISFFLAAALSAVQSSLAIVGATVIDGHGGPPLENHTILIAGKRIQAVGESDTVTVPAGARVIEASGKYVMPGIVDTNVHMSPLRGEPTFARYWDRLDEIVLQGVQLQLKHGTTTVRDSYGTLGPLMAVRDAIARGDVVGPRMYVAGNIIGWGGPYSDTFSRTRDSGLSLFQEQINDLFTQGTGEELMHMTPDELRDAMNAYLDKGPDFIKFGGTWHINYPTLISFSPRAQRVIVEETHKRGLVAETHSTTLEGLLISIEAGIDLIQHPEVVGHRELTDELVDLIVERRILCSLLPNKYTGEIWQEYLETKEKAEEALAEQESRRAAKTQNEIRRQEVETGIDHPDTLLIPNLEMRRRNGKKLIEAGARITVGPDNVIGIAPEFRRTKKSEHLEPGIGTLLALEGLAELGMAPSEIVVAATKNGAMAVRALDELGTVTPGKLADLLVLGADPTADISNVRKLEIVLKEGALVDLEALPTARPYGEW